MQIINESTAVIYTFNELKTILEDNNTYIYIYLGSNITLSSGITISSNKINTIIDGTYDSITYTLEDVTSSSSGNTISIRSANNQKVTVKNINLVGHNYYGIIYVPDSNTYRNVILEYDNITYVGPQIVFHPSGLTRFINASITINASTSPANEVAECNRIEIGGNTTIVHNSTSTRVFWFRGSTASYFKILSNANVHITSSTNEIFYGSSIAFEVAMNAILDIVVPNSLGYGTFLLNSFLVDENASLKINQTARNGSYPTLYCSGEFTLNKDSSLEMYNTFTNGNTSNYNIYLYNSNASLNINNPKKMILYNQSANNIYANTNISFNLNFTRFNMWTNFENLEIAGSIDNVPNYSWFKSNISTINGTINTTTTNILNHNYSVADLENLPNLSNFAFQNKRMLSIGNMKLNIDSISDESLVISGNTLPFTNIDITINNVTSRTSANSNGYFSFNLANALPEGTQIFFLANVDKSFIYQNKMVEIIYIGEITIEKAPNTITFSLSPFKINPPLCPRQDNFEITILDSRTTSLPWKLYASVDGNLISKNGYVLSNALVFINNEKEITILKDTPTVIYESNGNLTTTNITYNNDEGIILMLDNEPIEVGEEYIAHIIFSLGE